MKLSQRALAGGVAFVIVLGSAVVVSGLAIAGVDTSSTGSRLDRSEITRTMRRVGGYWETRGVDMSANNWKNATFHVGNLALARATGGSDSTSRGWAEHNSYAIPVDKRGPFFPDVIAPGEVYLDLLANGSDAGAVDALRAKIRDQVQDVASGHVETWNYVDALNMAMPSFARFGQRDDDEQILSAMQTLFANTEKVTGGHGLFSEANSLWWRDATFVGTKTFWSRGNGWAAMAMAKVLRVLPADDPRRPEYVRVLTRMAAKLASVQRPDGFWNVNLGDPDDFAGPETTGTAMFTFALAWGVNNGVLPGSYRAIVEKAWQGMVTKAVRADGLLGFCQETGKQPSDNQPVGETDVTAVGVGAFLLAGSEMIVMAR